MEGGAVMALKRMRVAVAVAFVFASAGAVAVVGQQSRSSAVVPPVMAPSEAHVKARAGEIVLVDIRTPEEWKETGVPASAHAITMHQEPRAFVKQLLAAMGGDNTRPVALICRTGNRSSTLQAELRKAGFSNVVDVAEGMAGGRNGKGWLKTSLPTRPGVMASAPPALDQYAGPQKAGTK